MKSKQDKDRIREEKKKMTQVMFSFFMDIWKERKHNCESCGKWLGKEPLSTFFDHLLEKSKYPLLRFEEKNIFLCCFECHSKKTNGFPTDKHKEAINEAKLKLLP